jgi:sugar/nucleoside kinase (ribokinase family)
MDSDAPPQFLVAGRIQRDYLLLGTGQACLDIPGGNLLYAASGLALWEPSVGMLGRVGQNTPRDWLERYQEKGLDTRGIRRLPEDVDIRRFIAYSETQTALTDNPVAHFARLGLSFPKELLDYRQPAPQMDSRTRMAWYAVRLSDIPGDYLNASAAHVCPLDYLAHSLLPSTFRQGHINTITVDAGPGYMNPTFWDYIPTILTGLTAFITAEDHIRSLFLGRSSDLWEMAETLASFGSEFIVIKRAEKGQYLYDAASRARYLIPPYPAQVVDPTGAGDAFCGGFLAGYRRAYDPLQAALYGNISASFTVEGTGVFYTLEAFSRLAESRRQSLQDMVRRL